MTTAEMHAAEPDLTVDRRRRDGRLILSFATCSLLTAIALVGRALAPYPPDEIDLLAASQGPSGDHWLGTDSLGRDILSRALAGARMSFAGPSLIVAGSVAIGTTIAIFAAWHGGWIDRALNRVINVMFAVPGVLVAVLSVALFGVGFWAPVVALTLVYTPYAVRVIRSAAVGERNRQYVESLRLAGLSSFSICSRHIGRNVAPLVIAQATIAFGVALTDFAAISFLGLGVQPPSSEWGVMLAEGRSEILSGSIQQSLTGGALIVVSVISFNTLGDRLAARFGYDR